MVRVKVSAVWLSSGRNDLKALVLQRRVPARLIMNLYLFRQTLFKRCLKYAIKNEKHERGYWLQMCRFKTSAPKNFCDYESMRQAYNVQVPQQFNFAKDVLEQWETKEKVI